MDYYKLLELQQLKLRREAMEKSYPRERELKLRKRKQQLLEEKSDLLILEEKLRSQAGDLQTLQRERDHSEEENRRLTKNLYEGEHSPKELQSMQNKLENLETILQQLRERIDRENEQACAKRQELKDRKDQLIDRMSDYEIKVEEYLMERSRLVEKLKQLDEQIEHFVAGLDAGERTFFDGESNRYGVEIFSILKKGRFCSCCNVLLETEILEGVKIARTGVRCNNCGRMILNNCDEVHV